MKSPTLVILDTLPAPGKCPAGLAWDGKVLWNADYCDGRIYGLNPDDLSIVNTLYSPGNLSGLAWDGATLWQSLFNQEMIRGINPVTNDFDDTIILSHQGWLSGVAWDGHRLWVVAQQAGRLLSIDRPTHKIDSDLPAAMAMGDIDSRDGTLWASVAEPMRFDPVLERFDWLSDEPNYALIQIDPVNGRELSRYPADRLYSGLCWAGDFLWLAHSGNGQLTKAQVV